MRVLVLNAGSSTLKASLVTPGVDDAEDVELDWPVDVDQADEVLDAALRALAGSADAVGHRAVHGGTAYRSAARVDDELASTVEALDKLAPLHNRRAALVMRAARRLLPELPHVACFDTAFHATLPDEAVRYPIPAEWVDRHGIRRFGFHGLSVAWAVRRAAELLGREVADLGIVVAHLGSGCSVTAVDGGRSVDTSMGMTPSEGLMMGTRSGSIDPGILLLLASAGLSVDELTDGLARRSGLRALAGTASAREVEEGAAGGDDAARLALGVFARRAAGAIASAATALRSVDAVVFTGGIGEHSVAFRAAITERLAVIGIPRVGVPTDGDAIAAAGPPAVLVVRAREDRVIADEVAAVVGDESPATA